MISTSPDNPVILRAPGEGADRADTTHQLQRYVYVARSRRAGGLSLGIDLTPHGHCSFSCIYCQASHPPLKQVDLSINIEQLRQDLRNRLQRDRGEFKDVVLAGSGEPTAVSNLAESLDVIQRVCNEISLSIPLKIFSNARHLHTAGVQRALSNWCEHGGQIWIKLDGVTDDTIQRINRQHFDVTRHIQAIWDFSKMHPIGLQTMMLRGPGLPEPERVMDELVDAVKQARADGARIIQWHLLTISRVPADHDAARTLSAICAWQLEQFGTAAREQTGLDVLVFPEAPQ